VTQLGAGQDGVSQPQDYAQPIPVGPGVGWSTTDIVEGFLAASASFADNHAVARQYLDSAAQRNWRPGWAVTVVNGWHVSPVQPTAKQIALQPGAGGTGQATVEVTGQPVATLTGAGQYLVSSATTASLKFSLVKVDGQWRIDRLPRGTPLLLDQADFEGVYQPRDLYFLAPTGQTLVPDPVFVPQQATDTELATGLVNALLQGPAGWLSGAAKTAFPAHSAEIGQVKIIGTNAIVNLGGNATKTSWQRREQMAAELAWTLATAPTSSVELEIDGRPQQLDGSTFQLEQTYHSWLPAQSAGPLYLIGGNRTTWALPGAGQPGSGQAVRVGGTSLPALSAVAVSPDGRSLAGISADADAVYISSLSSGGPLREWHSPSGTCTSLSWDAQGDLWIAAGGDLWMLPPGTASALPVDPDSLPNVSEFRVAPDGVRAIMIVQDMVNGKPSTQVQLAAITHSGEEVSLGQPVVVGGDISGPEQLSWFGTDEVIVLSDGPNGAQLDQVPLNGDPLRTLNTPGQAVSLTAVNPAGAGAYIAVGLSGGQIMVSADLGASWSRVSGSAPAYPG
jgi:hypothetical protein